MKVALAVFIATLPILIVCLLAGIISGLWGFTVAYFATWVVVSCPLIALNLVAKS